MNNREKEIFKVTLIGTALNALLIVIKFIAGIVGRSSAMVADAVHSLSDFITDLIVIIFVKISGRPHDKSHDYGHGKFETFATMIIGLVLTGAGLALLINGIKLIIGVINGELLPKPGMLALVVALLSIIFKESLYRYTVKAARRVNSQAVEANAWHHRSDAFSSGGTLIGIAGAMFLGDRWRILDPIAAVIVSFFIIKSGYDIMRPSINELLEASLPEEEEREITSIVTSVPGIVRVHNLRSRKIGNDVAIDLHAKMDGSQSLTEAHAKATEAEKLIKERFGPGTLINIHMEPDRQS